MHLKPYIAIWLDNIPLFAFTVERLLVSIEFFDLCVAYNIKLHTGKCILFPTKVRCFRCLITPCSVRYDPRRLESLLTTEPLTTGAGPHQFLCQLQWVKWGIPTFKDLVILIYDFLKRI